MKEIKRKEIIQKKSKFISILYEIDNIDEVKVIINNLKKEHPKAKHFPYAYFLNGTAGKSDDKEPHNTAGIQIYNTLNYAGLDHHLLVVIRYFGGTLLGAGNLLRTYLASAKSVCENEKDI